MMWPALIFALELLSANTPPKVVHRVEPRYTREARANGIQGTVLLQVSVDDTGKLGNISVLSPIGFGLDSRAVDAVRQWTFQPAMSGGKPVEGAATVEVKFRIFHRRFDPAAEERRNTFNLAVDAIQHKKPTPETYDTLRKLAQQKYPPAMYLYGRLLDAGDGVPQDRSQGLHLIFDAAKEDYPSAMFDIGRMMMEGRRLAKDPDKGLELVRNAAILGNRRSQFFLGVAYSNGYGVPQDTDRAHQNFRLCATVGESPCQVKLAKLLLENQQREGRDFLQAIAWLELAAEDRNDEARLILDQQHTPLSPEEISWIKKLKTQLVQRQ
jgi:TonB family protein